MWPSSTVGRPGNFKLHTWVDLTIVLSGRFIVRDWSAGQIIVIGVPFMTNMEVAPVPATALVGSIAGGCWCMIGAQTFYCRDVFKVTTVFLSSLLTAFLVGYKVGV